MTTLSFDSSESAPGELNSEEQESLAIGEQMQAEQTKMLAGKFKDAEALESAYLELQKKLGSSTETQADEPAEPEQESESNFLDTLWSESQDQLSEDTQEKLSKMDANELAQMYLEYRNEVEQASQPKQLSDEDIDVLHQSAGGEKEYQAMLGWAKDNLTAQEIDMYDAVMDRGDPQAAFFAIQALRYRYTDSVGSDGQMLTGKAATDTKDVFRSQAELVQAMSDPRYDNDPAYRSDILNKLDRSDLNF
jgi:hypothetical protein